MKRLWLAAAILAAAIGLCIITLNYQRQQTNALLSELSSLEKSVIDNGAKQALAQAEAFVQEFEHRTRLFPCFMSHNDLSGCHETVATLPATLATDHIEEFFQEVSRCRMQLYRLQDIEAPNLQNIF